MNARQKNSLIRIVVSLGLCIALWLIRPTGLIALIGFLVPYLIVGYDVLYGCFLGIKNKSPFDENFLMSIATVGAFVLGEYTEGVFVLLLYQVGELFQSYAVGRSRKSISDLLDIRPDYTYIENEAGELVKADPYDVSEGDYVFVKTGEKIALDGIVSEGESTVDTSALTGESVPRSVKSGDHIYSGSINLTGMLKIKVTKNFDESTASKILELVESSGLKKSKSENFIKKFARYYTPAVVLSAVALAVIPPMIIFAFAGRSVFSLWLYRALTFLVISCPCALVVSVPLTFFAGIGCAGKNGILIKGASYIEALSKASYLVFDKTGTLTEGVFSVVEICGKNAPQEQVLEYAALAESYTAHPIGESLKKSYGKTIDKSRVSCFTEMSGYGISAKIDRSDVLVGNAKLLRKNGIEFDEVESIGTVVYVALDSKYIGHILISDSIKAGADRAVTEAKELGIKAVYMLSGDKKAIADSVSSTIGIDKAFSELLPDGKVQRLEDIISLKKTGETVIFVGDGLNDAPVLARADVGIAMGAFGTDAAIEAADVVVMDDKISKVPLAVRISKKCMSIVLQNIVFAIGVKLLFLIFGAFGIADMWLAVFADVGVMIIAVLNAIRALKI